MDIFRDSPLGQVVRWFWKPQWLLYPEEKPGFSVPDCFVPSEPWNGSSLESKTLAVEKPTTVDQSSALEADRSPSASLIIVNWYSSDDPENPRNWSKSKRAWVVAVLILVLIPVYGATSIYVPSVEGVIIAFGVSIEKALLGLSLYVVGLGLGPMLFSPLSEVPLIGRLLPYITTFTIYVILGVPTALVDNFAGLLILRFLMGFFGSPPLATGLGTLQDMYSLTGIPYAICATVLGPFCAPAIGPTLSSFAVMNKNWHWSLWITLWLSAPLLVLMWLSFPETSADNILLRRARRLRQLTGNPNYVSQSEIDQAHLTLNQVLVDALIKPTQISILDPAILFANLYIMYIYGTYYMFFDVYPIVFFGFYHFNLGQIGLVFLPIAIGSLLGAAIYSVYVKNVSIPRMKSEGDKLEPEFHLKPALWGSLLMPTSMFFFAWTARHDIYWLVPLLGSPVFTIGAFLIFQSIILYLPLSYPKYSASLAAANDFCRSSYAAGATIFGEPLFRNLGVGRGVSLLGGLFVGGVIGIWLLYFFGARLRARSRFAKF